MKQTGTLPENVIRMFWNSFGSYVGSDAKVYGRRISLDMCLFFVDMQPEANWGHSCAYALVNGCGVRSLHVAEWPPDEDIMKKMKPVTRPADSKPVKGGMAFRASSDKYKFNKKEEGFLAVEQLVAEEDEDDV